jgi:hypothetical protein
VNSVLIETAESGRTIDALRLGEERSLRTHATISRWLQWERYTLRLRTRWFPLVETNYIIPVSAVLLMGSYLYHDNPIVGFFMHQFIYFGIVIIENASYFVGD